MLFGVQAANVHRNPWESSMGGQASNLGMFAGDMGSMGSSMGRVGATASMGGGADCPICGQTFKNSHGVAVHMGRMHKQ